MLSIMILCMTICIMTLSITALNMMTLSIMPIIKMTRSMARLRIMTRILTTPYIMTLRKMMMPSKMAFSIITVVKMTSSIPTQCATKLRIVTIAKRYSA
jgi:hypothetical protein